jgi:hypothetical protein
MEETMIEKQEAWKQYETYVGAWNAISAEQRLSILSEVFSPDISYFTPEFQGGRDAAIEEMEGFQQKFPGAHFDVEDGSIHHDVALFTWVLVLADGTALAKGHDEIRFSPEGKIAGLITFGPSTPKP